MSLAVLLPHRLALLSALWVVATTTRVLTPEFPAEDEAAEDEYQVHRDDLVSAGWASGAGEAWGAETIRAIAAEDQAGALRQLQESAALRAEVRGFVERALAAIGLGPECIVPVRAFGPGWEKLPTVDL